MQSLDIPPPPPGPPKKWWPKMYDHEAPGIATDWDPTVSPDPWDNETRDPTESRHPNCIICHKQNQNCRNLIFKVGKIFQIILF